ncbi:MAG: DUF2779 domain-containing protein [Mycoplasma sp.]|nr:DUF2779 domain-containing protein [Mycoplasma sp.]
MKVVKLNHFKKYITSDPYYIWNSKKIEEKKEDVFNVEFEWLKTDDSEFEEGINNATQVLVETFHRVELEFKEYIKETFSDKRIYFIKSKSFEDRAIETKKIIEDNKHDLIIDAVFQSSSEYNDDFIFQSTPIVLNIAEKEFYMLKPSTSTKSSDLLPFIWNNYFLKEFGIKIKNMYLVTIGYKYLKKGEISFYKTEKINTTKSPRGKNGETDVSLIQSIKTGNAFNKKGEPHEKNTILKNVKLHSDLFYVVKSKIIEAADIENDEAPNLISSLDFSKFGDNPLNKENREIFYVDGKFSGNLVRTKELANAYDYQYEPREKNDDKLVIPGILNTSIAGVYERERPKYKDGETYITIKAAIKKGSSPTIEDEFSVKALLDNMKKNVIWYDFEGYSLPYAAVDNAMPYQQIAFQCSIIRTKKSKIDNDYCLNIVKDPKNIQLDDFFDIIEKIYANKANFYVVYNQAYENTRLKEMLEYLYFGKHKKYEKAKEYVRYIIDNTVDLAKFFSCSKNNLPIILIPELYGFHSIKKIEKYITNSGLQLETMITPYKELEVQNGLMAMELAIKRSTGILGDNEWKKISEKLKIYCENDVRAMIMVKDFISKIYNDISK